MRGKRAEREGSVQREVCREQRGVEETGRVAQVAAVQASGQQRVVQ